MMAYLMALSFLFTTLLHAQDSTHQKKSKSVRFASINQLGFVVGASTSEPILQSVNGVQFHTWFAGLGVGLDYYKHRSIPIFLDIRRDVFIKSSTPFLYTAGGRHIVWRNSPVKEWISNGIEDGWFYDIGAGYKVGISKRQQVVVSIGYSVKYLSEEVNTMPWVSVFPPPHGAMQKRDYTFSRIAFKLGLGL